jgi:hypothetical protein
MVVGRATFTGRERISLAVRTIQIGGMEGVQRKLKDSRVSKAHFYPNTRTPCTFLECHQQNGYEAAKQPGTGKSSQ